MDSLQILKFPQAGLTAQVSQTPTHSQDNKDRCFINHKYLKCNVVKKRVSRQTMRYFATYHILVERQTLLHIVVPIVSAGRDLLIHAL